MEKLCKVLWDGHRLKPEHPVVALATELLKLADAGTFHGKLEIELRQGQVVKDTLGPHRLWPRPPQSST